MANHKPAMQGKAQDLRKKKKDTVLFGVVPILLVLAFPVLLFDVRLNSYLTRLMVAHNPVFFLQALSNKGEDSSVRTEEPVHSDGYLVFYPFARFSNNAEQLRKMLSLARHLRRKLLIPPLHYNDDEWKFRDARIANFPQLFDLQALNRYLHPLGKNCTFRSTSDNQTIVTDDIGLLPRSTNGAIPDFLNATIRNPYFLNDDCWALPWQFTNRDLSRPLIIDQVYCDEKTDWPCWKQKIRLYGRIPNNWQAENKTDYAPYPKPNSIKPLPLTHLTEHNATTETENNKTHELPALVVVTAATAYLWDMPKNLWATLPTHPQLLEASADILRYAPLRPGGNASITVGAHIRREDMSDRVPPLDTFISTLEQLVQQTNAGKLFIATNGNKDEIAKIQSAFPFAQIRCGLLESSGRAGWCRRLDLAILIEQVTVARCTHFVGSAASSFSHEIARHRQVLAQTASFVLL